MNSPKPMAVYLGHFPFVDKQKTKLRPVIIISAPHSDNRILIVVPISSKNNNTKVDFVIEDNTSAGLTRKSFAKVHRLTSIATSDLYELLGVLSKKDQTILKNSLLKLLLL